MPEKTNEANTALEERRPRSALPLPALGFRRGGRPRGGKGAPETAGGAAAQPAESRHRGPQHPATEKTQCHCLHDKFFNPFPWRQVLSPSILAGLSSFYAPHPSYTPPASPGPHRAGQLPQIAVLILSHPGKLTAVSSACNNLHPFLNAWRTFT